MERQKEENEDDRFAGKTFVLTGSLEKYSREEASNIIEKFGGKTSENMFVCGDWSTPYPLQIQIQ